MIDFSNPLNTAILHLPLTTHAFGNGLCNNCLLELLYSSMLEIVLESMESISRVF